MAVGLTHSLATTADGALYSWGSNGDSFGAGGGQLGYATETDVQLAPHRVEALSRHRVVRVAAGRAFSVVATSGPRDTEDTGGSEAGAVFSFGSNGFGQLGIGRAQGNRVEVPRAVPLPARAGNAQGPVR